MDRREDWRERSSIDDRRSSEIRNQFVGWRSVMADMATGLVESNFARLALEITSSAAHIALRNAPLNVIDISMMEDLARALAEIDARSDVSVIVLSGEG